MSFRFVLFCSRKENDGKLYVKYQVIGTNQVAVPTHFFKVLVGETPEGLYEMEAYVMPNQVISDQTPIHVFQVWNLKPITIYISYIQYFVFFFCLKYKPHKSVVLVLIF